MPSWTALLGRAVPRWLGSRSFSLYLVHEPIVVAAGWLLPARAAPFAAFATAGLVALAVAELFFRFVERPTHRLSRTVGKAISVRIA